MNKFQVFNDYFDAAFVISLDGYDKRQASIKSSLKGLNFEFWPGTDKRNLSEDVLKDPALYDDATHKVTKRTHRSMRLAEYACACSHRRIYEHMLEHNLQRVIIFEDDAVVNESNIDLFTQQISSLNEQWDLLLFDYYDCIYANVKGKLKQKLYSLCHHLHISNWQHVPQSLINIMLMEEYNEHFYHAGRLSGAHAYAITLETAKKYVEYQTPVILQADRIFYYYQEIEQLRVYASKQPLFLRGELAKNSSIQIR